MVENVQDVLENVAVIIQLTSKMIKKGLTFLFGAIMVFAGVSHFRKPEIYLPFIPDFMPEVAVNYVIGIIEIVVGIGVFVPQYRTQAAWGIFFLMVAFLPLHIADVFKEIPAIGTHQAALIRLPFQFVLISWAWFITRE